MRRLPRRFLFPALSLALLAQTQPAATPPRTSIAIYQIKPAGATDKSIASALTALLSTKLTPSPRLSVIEEGMLKAVMERQAMNVSDACDDTSCQVEIGKLVKAQKIITGDIIKLGARYILSLKLVDIQTGTLEFTTEDQCACTEDNVDLLVAAAGAKIRNHFGENLPIPALPVGQAFLPVAPAPAGEQAPLHVQPSPAQPPVTNWVPGKYTIQESHPAGTKGGSMVFVSDFMFYIDKFEVTNQDYQECVAARGCKKTKQQSGFDAPQQPVIYIDQNDARTYCQWAGKRLPKEQEWQEAAQGTDGRIYPWGNQEPNCSLANYKGCASGTVSVGSKPAGASPYGALDMAGNGWEWVEEEGVVRGGGWLDDPPNLLVSSRYTHIRKDSILLLYCGGFRCARDGSP